MNKKGEVFPLVINGEFTPHIFSLTLAQLNSRRELLNARQVSKIWRDFIDHETKIWDDYQIQCRAAIEGRVDIYEQIIQYAGSKNGESQLGNERTPLHSHSAFEVLALLRTVTAAHFCRP